MSRTPPPPPGRSADARRFQYFSERIVDCPFLSKGNYSILSHGVTLLLGGSGGLITNPVTPPSSHRHPVSSIAPKGVRLANRLAAGEDVSQFLELLATLEDTQLIHVQHRDRLRRKRDGAVAGKN